jgi:DNA-3-methyladenine glycosylase
LKSAISPSAPKPKSRSTSPHSGERLTRADLPHETHALARALIGTTLVRRFPDGGEVRGRIVETEAYPPGDPASHAVRGPTKRNGAMFLAPLHLYVYLIYGRSWCLNIVSEAEGVGAAVLLRALEPLDGIERMRAARGPAIRDRDLARGPGRLCAALAIDAAFDRRDVTADPGLWLEAGVGGHVVGTSTRIGLTKAAAEPFRSFERGSPFVSGPRALSEG